MPLPTERITLNQEENAKSRAGLNRVLNGIAEIKVNNRRSPDMLYPRVGSKFLPREFHQELYDVFLHLRNRLAVVAQEGSSKHRLTAIEFAILAFAVRIGRE